MKWRRPVRIAVPPLDYDVTDDGKTVYTKLHTKTGENGRETYAIHDDVAKFPEREGDFASELARGIIALFSDYGVSLAEGEKPGAEHWKRLALIIAIKHRDLDVCIDGEPIPALITPEAFDEHPAIKSAAGKKTKGLRHERIGHLFEDVMRKMTDEAKPGKRINRAEATRRVAKQLMMEHPAEYGSHTNHEKVRALAEYIYHNHNRADKLDKPMSQERHRLHHRVAFAYSWIAAVADQIVGLPRGKRSPAKVYHLPEA